MKLSALLLSVNIAASLPIAFCQMAPAAEEGVTDTSDWLKSNLATIKKGKADLPTSRLKVSMPEKISSGDKSFDAYVARLKPMHKAHKLPSQRDLDMQLVSQTPRMGVDPSQLNGNVSQSQYSDYSNSGVYRQPQSLAHSVPRSLSSSDSTSFKSSAVAMARQAISGAHHLGAAPSAKNIKSARRGAQSLQDRMDDWLGQPKGDEKMIAQAGATLVQAPVMPQNFAPLTAKEADLERQLGMPMGSAGAQPQQSSAGPAPFPLNLVPEAQLKNFIRGGRGSGAMGAGAMGAGAMGAGAMGGGAMGGGAMNAGLGHGNMRPTAPKAFFGSWHGSNHNLPKAGFRSNIYGAHYAQQHNVVQMRPKNRYSKGPKVVASRPVAKAAPRSASQSNYSVQAHLPPQVASYGPYTSHLRAF
ncbi:MAG: hypothetical protein C0469_05490 [Cyanobacteria bacterium DS2.3.42]|nr:hypothetical protein [Cyanobacteria bacterium DS2.3.42]